MSVKDVAISVLLVAGMVFGGWWLDGNNRSARYDLCVELEQVRTYARESAQRSLKSLPTINYYRSHPRERAKAVASIQQQVDFFSPPLDCGKFAKS